MPQVSLEDIARRAGVHRTTVSRALRNSPRLPEEQKRRLCALAEEMGYRPNPLVQALMAGRRQAAGAAAGVTLAYLHTYRRADMFAYLRRVHVGVGERAARLGFSLDEFFLGDEALTGAQLTRMLHARGIRGVIVSPFNGEGYDPGLAWGEFAAVAIGFALPHPGLHRVSHDHYRGLLTTLNTLSAEGVERIGLCVRHKAHRRAHGLWTAALREWQSEQPVKRRVPHLLFEDGDLAAYEAWLRRVEPEVVITCSKAMLEGFHRRLGKRVKRPAIATLCVSDPQLEAPGVDHHLEEIGAAAVDWVAGQLYRNEIGLPAVPRILLVEGAWMAEAPAEKSAH